MYSASVSFSVSSAVFSPCVSMILALVSVGQACRLRGEWRAVPRIGASSTTSNHSLQHEYVGDECRSLVARRRASRGSHSGQSGLSALGTGVRSGPCLVVPCRLIPLTSGKTTASPLTCVARARVLALGGLRALLAFSVFALSVSLPLSRSLSTRFAQPLCGIVLLPRSRLA